MRGVILLFTILMHFDLISQIQVGDKWSTAERSNYMILDQGFYPYSIFDEIIIGKDESCDESGFLIVTDLIADDWQYSIDTIVLYEYDEKVLWRMKHWPCDSTFLLYDFSIEENDTIWLYFPRENLDYSIIEKGNARFLVENYNDDTLKVVNYLGIEQFPPDFYWLKKSQCSSLGLMYVLNNYWDNTYFLGCKNDSIINPEWFNSCETFDAKIINGSLNSHSFFDVKNNKITVLSNDINRIFGVDINAISYFDLINPKYGDEIFIPKNRVVIIHVITNSSQFSSKIFISNE